MTAAVLDTNVVFSSQRGTNPARPNAVIIDRWKACEFAWLFTDDPLEELAPSAVCLWPRRLGCLASDC